MSGGRSTAVGSGRLPDDPTGRAAGSRRTGSGGCARLICGPSIAADRRFAPPRWYRSARLSQPCRNVRAGGPVGRGRPGRPLRPGTGPPRRRSPGRGAARPTRRRADRDVGRVEAAGACATDLVAERLDVRADRVQDRQPLDRPLADELDQPLAGLAAGPHPVDRVDHAVLDPDDRLDRQERADGRLGAADPAALLEVLEGLERDVHPHVRRPRLEGLGDLRGRPAVGGQLDAHPGQDPLGHRRAERVDDVDLAVGQHVPRDLGALDRARQRARDVDRDDRLGAGRRRPPRRRP